MDTKIADPEPSCIRTFDAELHQIFVRERLDDNAVKSKSAALGQLHLIACPRLFQGPRRRCRGALADFLGAAHGIERGLRVALELRHHLACDQLLAAQRYQWVRPVLRQ
jgi:hypothetical protein